MLYTDNVNRIIFWAIIPLLLISYFAFRVFEWRIADDGNLLRISEQHHINLRELNGINCLILGGSNSVFSVSAKQMSVASKLKCYNLSLLNEGYSDKSYFDFIKKSIINKNDIDYIFYSTIYPLNREWFSQRLERNRIGYNLNGDSSFELLGTSLASRLKNWLQNDGTFQPEHYPLPTASGDFNFDKYDACNSETIKGKWSLPDVDDTLSNWVNSQITTMQIIFPNAVIYLVLPSVLDETISDRDISGHAKSLEQITTGRSVYLIQQSPFKDRSMLCDGPHHTNAIGREIRTRELLTMFEGIR